MVQVKTLNTTSTVFAHFSNRLPKKLICAISTTRSRSTTAFQCEKRIQPSLKRKAHTYSSSIKCNAIESCDAEQLEVAIANRDRPMIIDFYATWCGPCLLMAKELEEVAEKMGEKIRILKVDTDKNEQLSTQLRIQGLPTLMFIGTNAEKPALRTEGFLPAEAVIQIIENEL